MLTYTLANTRARTSVYTYGFYLLYVKVRCKKNNKDGVHDSLQAIMNYSNVRGVYVSADRGAARTCAVLL